MHLIIVADAYVALQPRPSPLALPQVWVSEIIPASLGQSSRANNSHRSAGIKAGMIRCKPWTGPPGPGHRLIVAAAVDPAAPAAILPNFKLIPCSPSHRGYNFRERGKGQPEDLPRAITCDVKHKPFFQLTDLSKGGYGKQQQMVRAGLLEELA